MLLSCNFKCSQPIAPLDLPAGFIQARTIASSMGRACHQAQRTQGATRRRIVGSLCDQSSAEPWGVVPLHTNTRTSRCAHLQKPWSERAAPPPAPRSPSHAPMRLALPVPAPSSSIPHCIKQQGQHASHPRRPSRRAPNDHRLGGWQLRAAHAQHGTPRPHICRRVVTRETTNEVQVL